MVEHQLPKLTAWVRFPSPAPIYAPIAQLAERIHGKDEVIGPIPIGSSNKKVVSQRDTTFLLDFFSIVGNDAQIHITKRSAGKSLRSKKRGIQGKRTMRSGAYEDM